MYSFENRQPFPLKENYMNMGGTNPSGDTIYLNNLYLTKNGKPFTPVMGEMHIGRCPREYWEDRILKIKACGVNIIASYVFWINHEFNEGEFDFEGENDISYFIRLCQKHDMYFCLRFGPWVNAEYRNGGIPDWLFKSDVKIRDNNEKYLFYAKRYLTALYENIKGLFFKDGGPIIMIQIDNELTNKPDHIMALKEMALEIGYSAPIFTATGWNMLGGALLPKQEVMPMFGGYAAKPWTQNIDPVALCAHYNFSHARNSAEIGNDLIDQNSFEVHIDPSDYPYAYCELGVGICISRHRRPFVSSMDDYAMVLTKLGSGCNLLGYYLICGGINPLINNTAMCRNNDIEKASMVYPVYNNSFQAAIGEHGEIKESFRMLKWINLFVNDFCEEFAPMQPFLGTVGLKKEDDTSLRYALRKNGDSGYIFVNHHAHLLDLKPVYGVQFEVGDSIIPEKPIDVVNDDAFFFPFNVNYGGVKCEYIMAQPICKTENTYFFKEIKGVEPVFKFKNETVVAEIGKKNAIVRDDVRFVVLSEEEARLLYKFEDNVYFGVDCDLIFDDGEIKVMGGGVGEYLLYKNGTYERFVIGKDLDLAEVSVKEIDEPKLDKTFFYELFENVRPIDPTKAWGGLESFMVERKLKFYKVCVSTPYGNVHIKYSGNTAQLYYDGKMCDDNFYNGMEWVVPAKHMYGREVVLVISEHTHDIYVDVPPTNDLSLDEVYVERL